MRKEDPLVRLMKKTDKNGPIHPGLGTNCWVWLGGKFSNGYGSIRGYGENYAHRVSWVSHIGVIPDGILVLHHCDNIVCVNPDHLFLGTDQDNSDDKMRKGRDKKSSGDSHWTRLYPDRVPRGDRSGPRMHPERMARGDRHPFHLYPELIKKGEDNGNSKLTEVDVIEIIRLGKMKVSYAEIQRRFNMSRIQIGRILNGHAWKHIPRK